jgi:hypothetical protein
MAGKVGVGLPGQRRKREKAVDKRKTVQPGAGPTSYGMLPLLPPPLLWVWGPAQSAAGESMCGPIVLPGHCLYHPQFPKPPWPSQWWKQSGCAGSGTASLPGGGCWTETASLGNGPEHVHIHAQVLQSFCKLQPQL